MNEGKKACGKPSRGRYAQGCRCFMCRLANSQYEYDRTHGAGAIAFVGEAETKRARARVAAWREAGIGLRTIELWTGVCRSSLQTLASGNHPHSNGATKRMSRENYEAIMAAEPRIAKSARVGSAPALAALAELRSRGLTFSQISDLSGVKVGTLHGMAYQPRASVTYAAHCGLAAALASAVGRKQSKPRLEEWQWQEARADFARGVDAATLAERYGVGKDTIRAHMARAGVAFASQASVRQGRYLG